MQKVGAHTQADYFTNVGGVNASDSPFVAPPSQAAEASRNFEYTKKGGFRKRLGLQKYNTSADTELRTYGIFQRLTSAGVSSTIRAAARKIQKVALSTATFTNLSEDTSGAGTDFLAASTTQPVAETMFSTANADVLWLSGGGMSSIYGAYSDTKVTQNGSALPTGAIGLSVGGSGSSLATGTYFYSVALRKASTQAISNADLDNSIAVTAGQDVTIDLSTITSTDTTKYDKFYIYRSSLGGVTDFTAGSLVAIVDSTDTSYVDDGTNVSSSTAVPRAGSTSLDNSMLPSGTAKYTTLFKRRLVTVIDNTVYISDTNKPESWPTINQISLPTGGEVTGLAVISFNTPTSTGTDEFLCVFKEDELRVITGTGAVNATTLLPDWRLIFVDKIGCSAHNSLVNANGYLAWVNMQGFYLWDGSGKPIYASKLIEEMFATDGDLDVSKLNLCWGTYYKKQQQIYWQMSHDIYGEQKYALKMDLRLTLPSISSDLSNRILEAAFVPDSTPMALYDGMSYVPNNDSTERLVTADDVGFVYRHFAVPNDADAGIEFEYETLFLDQNQPGIKKDYLKVIAWVDDVGSWDLTLNFWTDYRAAEDEKSVKSAQISSGTSSSTSLWDVAFWDQASWDDARTIKLKPIVFNLRSPKNNTQGDAIKLRFEQSGADEPVTVYGYSIIYAPVGAIK